MKRKYLIGIIGLLCALFLSVGLAVFAGTGSSGTSGSSEMLTTKKDLRFHQDGSFQIVILSDLRLSATPDSKVIANIEKVLDEAKPDLVVLGGDVHDGSVTNETQLRAVLDAVSAPIEERQIPWCHAFGVDTEKGGYSKEAQMAVYASYEYCISEDNAAKAYGVGNYVLPIKYAESDKVGFNVFCMDSNGYLNDYEDGLEDQVLLDETLSGGTNLDCLHYSQLLWYWDTSLAFEEYNNGNKVPAMMYFQIAPWQFNYVFQNKGMTKMTGMKKEDLTSSERDSGVVWTCFERGDVKGIFCGYDGKNSYTGSYLDMLLGACPTIGAGSDEETAGARVVTLSRNGAKMESSMIYLGDLFDLQISVDKTVFAQGEDIKVHYTGLAASEKNKDLELRLDLNGNHAVQSKDYVNLTQGEGSEPADVYRGESGKVSFSTDGYRGSFPYATGTYTLAVMQYPERTIISNTITIEVVQNVISVPKTTFASGEPIVISFSNYDGPSNAELRMDIGHGLDPVTYPAHRVASKWCDPMSAHLDTGTVMYASDIDRNGKVLDPGEYTLWIMDYSENGSIISNALEIIITEPEPPKLSIEKTEFEFGESVAVSFENLFEEQCGKGAELRVYSKNAQTVGVNPSVMYFKVTDSNGVMQRGSSGAGTVMFPADDGRGNTTIPLGEYVVKLISGNNELIADVLEFSVTAPDPVISLSKTKFASGESVTVSFSNLTAGAFGKNVELRVYSQDAQTVGKDASKMYFKLTDENGALTRGTSGTVTFPADDARGNKTIPTGSYVLKLISGSSALLTDPIDFTVETMNVITISTEKTTFNSGENIVIRFTNDYTGYTGAELRLDEGDQDPVTYPENRVASKWCPAMKDIKAQGTYTMRSDVDRSGSTLAPGTYTLWVMDYSPAKIISNKILITIVDANPPAVSMSKTEFTVGENVAISYANINPAKVGKNVELRVYSKDAQTVGKDSSKMFFTLTNASGAATRGQSGTVTFPADDARGNKTIPVGTYVVKLLSGGNVLLADPIEFTVQNMVTLSTEKTTFTAGEEIVVSIAAASSYTPITNQELRMDAGDQDPETYPKNRKTSLWCPTMLELQGKTSYTMKSDVDRSGKAMAAGTYTIWVMDYNNNTVISNKILITIEEPVPEISMGKTEFLFGESITVSFANLNPSKVGKDVELRVYSKDAQTVGKDASKMYFILTDKETGDATRGKSGTVTFPADDARGNTTVPAGKYVVKLIDAKNNLLADPIEFKVVEPISGAQPTLQDSITVTYYVEIDPSVTETKMVYNYKGAEIEVEGFELDAGLWAFDLPEVLPQDMNENIAATLYIGDQAVSTKETYSMKQYCMNQLEKTTDADAELRALLVALLNYGTESQKYFEGATEGFANADLTDLQKAYLPVFDIADARNVIDAPLSGTADASYKWKSATLGLFDKISIRFKFQATDISKLVLDINGKSYSGDDFVSVGNNTYAVEFKGIMPESYDDTVTAKFMVDSVQVGQTVSYNVNTYLKNKMNAEAVKAIVQAIYDYGCAAEAYGDL